MACARCGVEHILRGIGHSLFVPAQLLIVSYWRKLVTTLTAFTLALATDANVYNSPRQGLPANVAQLNPARVGPRG